MLEKVVSLRVHAPKKYRLLPQSTYIGTTLRPKSILVHGPLGYATRSYSKKVVVVEDSALSD